MMTQLLENTKKNKKSSTHGKKKHTPTSSESSKKEEKEDALHIEISSKHSKPSDSDEGVTQCLNKLERNLDAVVNQGKMEEASHD